LVFKRNPLPVSIFILFFFRLKAKGRKKQKRVIVNERKEEETHVPSRRKKLKRLSGAEK